jgi:hypothetical protein
MSGRDSASQRSSTGKRPFTPFTLKVAILIVLRERYTAQNGRKGPAILICRSMRHEDRQSHARKHSACRTAEQQFARRPATAEASFELDT